MDAFRSAVHAHPIGFALYVALAAYMGYRLGHMLRQVWRVSRKPKDRRAALMLSAVLGAAFCGLFTFLFVSLFT